MSAGQIPTRQVAGLDEQIRDIVGALLVAGANVSLTVNDAGDTVTIAATNTTDPEVVRDTMAAALVAGANVTITPNDAGDTITIASTGGGTSLTVQDENGTVATGVTQLDFQGAGVTASAGSGEVIITIPGGGSGITPGFHGAKAVAASQSIANNVFAPLSFSTEEYDTDAIHDTATNPTRFTVPAGMGGVWRFSGTVAFGSSASVTRRGLNFVVNGATVNENGALHLTAISSVQNTVSSTVDLLLVPGDYVELAGLQSTGSALNVTGKLSCMFLGYPAGWQDFTPTLNNFPATVNYARKKIDGKTCRMQVALTLTGVPTGRMEVVAPDTALATLPTGNMGPVGTVIGNDVGTARRLGAAFFLAGNVIAFGSTDVTSFWGVSTPHVWASGDTLAFNAEYELA